MIFNNKTTYLIKKKLQLNNIDQTQFRFIDYENDNDLDIWCHIVNNSYSDASYNRETGYKLLKYHMFVKDAQTVFYYEDSIPVANISFGLLERNNKVGSFFRIAVLPDFQNRGIGKKLLAYAEKKICSMGGLH